jgi:hypothetical protein
MWMIALLCRLVRLGLFCLTFNLLLRNYNMFIQTLAAIDATPTPSLGLLPAIHDAQIEMISEVNNGLLLKNIKKAIVQDLTALVLAEIVGNELILTAKNVGVLSISATSTGVGVLNVVSTQVGDPGLPQISKLTLIGNVAEDDVYSVSVGGSSYSITYGSYQLPEQDEARGRVFFNDVGGSVVLPESGRWPSLSLASGQLCGGDGRVLYEVTRKAGTSSYYPQVFERNIYTFSFSNETFPLGDIFEFVRFFYFRLIGNNTTATWCVIFEVGEIVSQSSPAASISAVATLTSGQKTISVPPSQAVQLTQWMAVSGDGILGSGIGDQKTYIYDINTQTGVLTLTQAATASGQKTLAFTAPVGPNIERINWLPPLLEQKVHLTDLKSMNELGIWIKNHGTREIVTPDLRVEIDPNRNEAGFEGYRLVYAKRDPIPHECLPTSSNFVIRLRIGQFDTENSVSSPKGYAAYLIRADEEDNPSADSA